MSTTSSLPEGSYLELCVNDQHIEDQYVDRLFGGNPVILPHKLIIPYYPLDQIRNKSWCCYKHLAHKTDKFGKEKRCYPSNEKLVYPENESGYVFLLKTKDRSKDTRSGVNTKSSGAALRSSPPAGCDGAALELLFLVVFLVVFLAVRMVRETLSL